MIKLRQILMEADFEYDGDGLRINSIDKITPEQWEKISRLISQRGYDSRGGQDAKRAVINFMERSGKPVVKHPHWAEVIAHVVGLKPMKTRGRKIEPTTIKKVFASAVRTFGVTANVQLAGWILPNGKLLNFSHEGVSRDKDHSEISTILTKSGFNFDVEQAPQHAIKKLFTLMGAIRINGEGPQIMIGKLPTREQFHILDYLFHVNEGEIHLDMLHQTYGETGKVYEKGTDPKQIYFDILRFYKSGQGPKR